VRSHPAPPAARRIFSWFVSKDVRESLIGDLEEEYAARMATDSSSAALRWYLRQICASIPPLLWIRLTRATWLATLGVALLAYITVGVAQLIVFWAASNTFSTTHHAFDVIVIFPIVVLIGYFAERLRSGAAILLGAMMLIAITAMTVFVSESSPVWYRVAWFLVGPTAAYVGGVLRPTVLKLARRP